MSDERLRSLERAHAAGPTAESLRALRLEKFRLGLDPFPRELLTEEWEAVFEHLAETKDLLAVHLDGCYHGGLHECSHTGAQIHDEIVVKKGLPLRFALEDVRRVQRHSRTEQTTLIEALEGVRSPIPEMKLEAYLVLDGDCTLFLQAFFLRGIPGLPATGLAGVQASHQPCPAPKMPPGPLATPYALLDQLRRRGILPPLKREGKDVTVNGRPVELVPAEEFQVESGWPGLYRTQVLDGVLIRRPICICGHSYANHGTPDNIGHGPCIPGECSCQSYVPASETCGGCDHNRQVHVEAGCMGAGTISNGLEGGPVRPVCTCPGFVNDPPLSEEQLNQLREIYAETYPELRQFHEWLSTRPVTCSERCRERYHDWSGRAQTGAESTSEHRAHVEWYARAEG